MNRSPLLFGASVLISGAVLLFGFLLPRGEEVSALRESVSSERQELDLLGTRLSDLRAADPVALSAAANRFRGLIPGAASLTQFLAMLDALASQDGVSVTSVSVGVPMAGASGGITAVGMNISVAGQYFAIAEFLFDLEHAPRLVRVGTVALSNAASGGVQATLSAEIYTTDPNAGPGSDPASGPEVGA